MFHFFISDPDEDMIDQSNKRLGKVAALALITCLILYIASVALLQVVAIRTESKGRNEIISNLTLTKMYAIMLLVSSVFMPCDKITNQIRCLKYLKLVFITVSLAIHVISLAMFTMLLYCANVEILGAIFLQTLGTAFHGFYLRTALISVFEENDSDFEGSFIYDASPVFGVV